tara:strand:- start:3057 stop:4526 length:1470 start_codon:yes stop_codon:yes gene_type:complete
MHAILNFYVFLWKNKTVFLFFLTIIPLMSFFYLQQNQQKVMSVIEVSNYDLANFKNEYTDYNAKITIEGDEIKTSLMSYDYEEGKKALKSLNNEIIADISYATLKELEQNTKELSLKVAALLEKKKVLAKLKDSGNLTETEAMVHKDELAIIDNLYKKELEEFQKADIDYKSYSLEKNIKQRFVVADNNFAYKFSLSVAFALFMAILVSYLRGVFNPSFDDELEIKKATNLKTMEGLPRFKKLEIMNNKLSAGKLNVHSLTEISRIFKYITARDRKAFEVVSSVKNEGNTFLAYALAQHAAENGHKVLLLDLNLRNMELSIKLTKSIENWDIADKNFDKLEEKTVNLRKGLDFLPALKDDKTLEMLKTSKGLKELIEHLKTKYDYIFIDTTAVFSVNIHNIDSVILAEAVDGVLINYLANRTKKRILFETIDKINMSESNILGIVVNNRYNPKLKDELLAFCNHLEKFNKSWADSLRVKILKSYLLDEE